MAQLIRATVGTADYSRPGPAWAGRLTSSTFFDSASGTAYRHRPKEAHGSRRRRRGDHDADNSRIRSSKVPSFWKSSAADARRILNDAPKMDSMGQSGPVRAARA